MHWGLHQGISTYMVTGLIRINNVIMFLVLTPHDMHVYFVLNS